jgi:hypothetical protein
VERLNPLVTDEPSSIGKAGLNVAVSTPFCMRRDSGSP